MAETTDGKLINRQDVIGFIVIGIAFGFLVIVFLFAVRTFSPQKSYFPESISVNIVDAGGRNRELSTECKFYLKEQLHTALMEVSGKAESAYNEKFATLLTILAVFGVAWPVILALLHIRFNESEIKKIEDAEKRTKVAEDAAKKAEERTKAAEEAAKMAEERTKTAEEAAKRAEERTKAAEGAAKRAEEKTKAAEGAANNAATTASFAYSSVMEYQDTVDKLNGVKNDICNDFPFVYQTLASYFSYIRSTYLTKDDIKSYLFCFVFQLEMLLKGLYYACLLDNSDLIRDMEQIVLKYFEDLDEFMKQKKVSEKLHANHLDSFNWDVIASKINSDSYKRIKDIYNNRLCEKGVQS